MVNPFITNVCISLKEAERFLLSKCRNKSLSKPKNAYQLLHILAMYTLIFYANNNQLPEPKVVPLSENESGDKKRFIIITQLQVITQMEMIVSLNLDEWVITPFWGFSVEDLQREYYLIHGDLVQPSVYILPTQ
jgi:hypothetical protein